MRRRLNQANFMLVANFLLWALLPASLLMLPKRRGRLLYMVAATLVTALVCLIQDTSLNKDRNQYVYLINAIADEGLALMEPGYLLLVKLLATFSSGVVFETLFFLLVALASVSVKMVLFDRYGGNLFGCVIAYLSYFFLLHEMTQIRIGLAIGLLYFSWFSWIENRRISYYVFGLLATLFHVSCLIFIIAPWMLSVIRFRRWYGLLAILVGMCVMSLVTSYWFASLISLLEKLTGLEKLALYLELFEDGVFSEISPVRLIPHLILLALYVLRRKYWRDQLVTVMLVRIHLVGILIFMALSPMPVVAYRMSDLFLFASIMLVGRLRHLLSSNLYYPFVIAYTGVFILYTTQWSGLFAPTS